MQILDLAIGLIFIYFILSIVCSVVQEIFANLFNLRYNNLKRWIVNTFNTNGLGHAILKHKVIEGLTQSCKPSYIPSDKFAGTILDLVNNQVHGSKAFDINSLREAIEKTDLLSPDMKRFLLQSIQEAQGEVARVRKDLEVWFNDAMDRIGGAYKKKVQLWIFFISIVVVTAFNADAITLTRYLYDNPDAARAVVSQAEHAVNDPAFKETLQEIQRADTTKEVETIVKEIKEDIARIDSLSTYLASMQLPLGWNGEDPANVEEWFQKVVGILISILAVSLGAPFWFEILNKLVNLRNAGRKPGGA